MAQYSIWQGASPPSPAMVQLRDGPDITTGTRFYVDRGGLQVKAVRYYTKTDFFKDAPKAPNVVGLFNGNGVTLVQQDNPDFGSDIPAGDTWVDVLLDDPFPLDAETAYYVGAWCEAGWYTAQTGNNVFTADVGVSPLIAPQDGSSDPDATAHHQNGAFIEGAGVFAFPDFSFQSGAYYIDVIVEDIPSGDIPVLNLSSAGTAHISDQSGKDSYTYDFQVSEDCQAYEVRLVDDALTAHTDGILVESGGAISGSTTIEGSITYAELLAADVGLTDGTKILKFFAQDLDGNWSD